MARASAIFPALRYENPAAAIDWLTRTLGFRRHFVAEEGGVTRPLRLDGVHIAAGASSGQVELTWRVAFLPAPGSDEVRVGLADEEEADASLAEAARPERAYADIDWSGAP